SLSRTASPSSADEAFMECIEAIEEFDDGVVIIYELPNRDHEVAYAEFTLQFMSAFANLPFKNRITAIGAASMYPLMLFDHCYKFCRHASLQAEEAQEGSGQFKRSNLGPSIDVMHHIMAAQLRECVQ
ncbi:11997_t:CDS:2, partial [Dentiscutata erythropus]